MDLDKYWQLFVSTGEVSAYLAYRQHEPQEKEEHNGHENCHHGPGDPGNQDKEC